jgi:hypothetical protein
MMDTDKMSTYRSRRGVGKENKTVIYLESLRACVSARDCSFFHTFLTPFSSGPFKDYYDVRVAQGRDPALLRLSVARKLAALVLSLWKKGGRYRVEPVKQA